MADIDRIRNVANRVAEYRQRGDQVVVVVSAMKGVTDNLIDMAKSLMPVPSEREMDVLLSTGEQTTIAAGHRAAVDGHSGASMTGAQAGIVTDGVHSKAKIRNITPEKIHELLDAGNVTIVAGFQGQTTEGHITTLAGWLRPHGDRAGGGVEGGSVPDFYRRRRRLHHRPAHRTDGEEARGSLVRRDARIGTAWARR